MTAVEKPEERDHATEGGSGTASPLSTPKRIGYGLLGTSMTAMGFWIFPHAVATGAFWNIIVGAGLAVLGAVVLYRAMRGKQVGSAGGIVDFLSDLAG